MSFRDDRQLARACEALCARVRKGRCWVTEPHPSATDFAVDVRDGKVGLSHGEFVIVRVAWAFWNGERSVSFADVIQTLSHEHQVAIFTLAIAVSEGPAAIDRWLALHEQRAVTEQSGWFVARSDGKGRAL